MEETPKIPWVLIVVCAFGVVAVAPLAVYTFSVKRTLIKQVKQPDLTPQGKEEETQEFGQVDYWSFDETEDFADGEISGASQDPGVGGITMTFDGVDDYLEMKQGALKKVGEIKYGTISLWFKFESLGSAEFLPILSLGEVNDQTPISTLVIEVGHFGYDFPADTKLYYTLYNKTLEPVLCFDSNENLKADTWYHFAVVNSPSGNVGYLNGVELTGRHYNFGTAADTQFFADLKNKDSFRLGYGWFGIDRKFHHFRGSIGEVRIYNRALTSDEIKALATL